MHKTEVLKQVWFCNDKEEAARTGKPYSGSYDYMQVTIDYTAREVITFLKSNWNSTYDETTVATF